jgi:hypothetical protein
MRIADVTVAIVEARRFIERAVAAHDRLRAEPTVEYGGSKETGACRRASLDLTRALAQLRKSPRV